MLFTAGDAFAHAMGHLIKKLLNRSIYNGIPTDLLAVDAIVAAASLIDGLPVCRKTCPLKSLARVVHYSAHLEDAASNRLPKRLRPVVPLRRLIGFAPFTPAWGVV